VCASIDGIIAIPTFKYFSSLNLAQSVNVIGYELFKRATTATRAAPDAWLRGGNGERLARKDEVRNLMDRLEKALIENGYQHDDNRTKGRRHETFRSLGNLFQRVSLSDVINSSCSTR
jgi:tRNA C32,U32 (ribose-2'-O)-methylase TrmJ